MNINQRLNQIHQTIQQTEQQNHRHDHVKLLAVSKTKPLKAVEQAYQAGQRYFGENYVQEGVDKINAASQSSWLTDPIEWHFIGPLQSNKTRIVAEHFDWVQTVDREKIAKRLSEQRPQNKGPLNICIQINISNEQSKSGISLTAVSTLAALINSLPNLQLRGLMAIGGRGHPEQEFQKMHQAFTQLQKTYPQVDTLSMGMTGDMSLAIANGSTLVRIGTAIFGERDYSQKPQ
ncbi:MAG: Pyridoxal phosphate homeostasis protein [Candidatus Celerinatantimonas neptuna]|nr:MAG: Pyridoxal phosphate homeostasis protein [Candidatus Celerinatantimonas neptuna]